MVFMNWTIHISKGIIKSCINKEPIYDGSTGFAGAAGRGVCGASPRTTAMLSELIIASLIFKNPCITSIKKYTRDHYSFSENEEAVVL